MQKVAWNRVTSQTIANYYRRASIVKDICTTDDAVETGAEETDTAANLPTGVTPQEFAAYVAIDNDLPVSANLTDADICADVWGPAADADESDAEEDTAGHTDANDCPLTPPVTFADALQSLWTIRSYWRPAAAMTTERFMD